MKFILLLLLPISCFSQKNTVPPGDTLNMPNGINSFTGLTDIKHVAWMPLIRNIYIERNWYYDFDKWGHPVYFPQIKKDTLPPPDTTKVTLQVETSFPCGTGCFLLGVVKAYRIRTFAPGKKTASDSELLPEFITLYYDQNWKRIKKYFEPVKEEW